MAGKVVCLGECLMDRLFERSEPTQKQPVFWTDYPGGAPANVAAALVKLGTNAQYLGCLGKDAVGNQLLTTLSEIGVDCREVVRHTIAPTRVVLVTRNRQGDRKFIGFSQAAADCFADTYYPADDLPVEAIASAQWLVMGTLGLAYPEMETAMKRAKQVAQHHGVKIAIDLNWRPVFWSDPAHAPEQIRPWLAQIDLLKLSQEEAQWLFQTDSPHQIRQQVPGVSWVVVTAGEQGCRYATPNHQGTVPAFQVESEDTTGAGDAFLAGVLHQSCQQGWDALQAPVALQQCLEYASAVGALTTLRPGAIAAQPTAKEVDSFLYLLASHTASEISLQSRSEVKRGTGN